MAQLAFHKVSALPGTLAADALYFVENGTYAESYVTDADGVAHAIGNTAMVNALAGAVVTTALADLNVVTIVTNIAARNALTLNRNLLVLVSDATGDGTVTSGAALYAYNEGTTAWTKLTEYESLDVSLAWASITGKPTSAPSLIDDAVTKRHTHSNAATLDKLGESGGALTFDGDPVGGGGTDWSTTNW